MRDTKKWVGTSWKMNNSSASAQQYSEYLRSSIPAYEDVIQSFVIPGFTMVRDMKSALTQTSVLVGAQNMHWEDAGAWTGEVSPAMLVDCDLDIVELGHSERRTHFGETDETVGLKVAAALRHGLIPLICVGETRTEYEAGQAKARLESQVRAALSQVHKDLVSRPLMFAYEPVWAIGDKGVPASSDYANTRQAEIVELASDLVGERVPCLYGGSVNAQNCEELIDMASIDGLFIGRAAWAVEGYIEIIKRCAAVIRKEGITS